MIMSNDDMHCKEGVMTFRDKRWERFGNRYHLIGTQIDVYQWNSGKNANFLVTAGYRNSNHKERSFPKGETARDDAIMYATSLIEKYRN